MNTELYIKARGWGLKPYAYAKLSDGRTVELCSYPTERDGVPAIMARTRFGDSTSAQWFRLPVEALDLA